MVLLLMSWLLCLCVSMSFSAGFYELTPFHLSDSYPRLGPARVSPPPGSPSFYSLPPLRSVLTTGWCPPHTTTLPPSQAILSFQLTCAQFCLGPKCGGQQSLVGHFGA